MQRSHQLHVRVWSPNIQTASDKCVSVHWWLALIRHTESTWTSLGLLTTLPEYLRESLATKALCEAKQVSFIHPRHCMPIDAPAPAHNAHFSPDLRYENKLSKGQRSTHQTTGSVCSPKLQNPYSCQRCDLRSPWNAYTDTQTHTPTLSLSLSHTHTHTHTHTLTHTHTHSHTHKHTQQHRKSVLQTRGSHWRLFPFTKQDAAMPWHK